MGLSSDLYMQLQEAEYYQSEDYQLRASLLPYPSKPTNTTNPNNNAKPTNIQNQSQRGQ